MLKHERFRLILDCLHREGQVQLGPLSTLLQVSEDTVRRDVDELARQGAVTKIRGGALLPSPIPTAYAAREQHDAEAKQQIARKALTLIEDGQLLILDGGTTAGWLARQLPRTRQVTVATNSLPVVAALLDHPGVKVLFAGGRVHAPYRVTLGQETVDFFRQLRATWCFLGAYGLHPAVGLTVANAEEAAVKRAMVQAAQHVAALVTTEKLGTAEPYVVCEVSAVHTIITPDAVPADQLVAYRQPGINLL